MSEQIPSIEETLEYLKKATAALNDMGTNAKKASMRLREAIFWLEKEQSETGDGNA